MKPLTSPPIGVLHRPSTAYLKGRVVRLAGGLACPNCNHTLRAIDTVIDNVDLTLRVGIVTSTSCASRAGSSFRT
jgi:hypothetical protein